VPLSNGDARLEAWLVQPTRGTEFKPHYCSEKGGKRREEELEGGRKECMGCKRVLN
jgi:hypothetical protein